jgi:hypothetical protein
VNRHTLTLKLAKKLGVSQAVAALLMSNAERDLLAACDDQSEVDDVTPYDVYQLAADRGVW